MRARPDYTHVDQLTGRQARLLSIELHQRRRNMARLDGKRVLTRPWVMARFAALTFHGEITDFHRRFAAVPGLLVVDDP